MQQFVIIFHQGTTPLTEADIQKRAAETRVWAQIQNAAGHQLDPRILAPENHWHKPDGSSGSMPTNEAGAITALLFLLASDFAQAIEVARAHPAVRYGSSIEIRSWEPPVVPK